MNESDWLAPKVEAGRPDQHRDPVPFDETFLRACGARPEDIRDSLLVLDR